MKGYEFQLTTKQKKRKRKSADISNPESGSLIKSEKRKRNDVSPITVSAKPSRDKSKTKLQRSAPMRKQSMTESSPPQPTFHPNAFPMNVPLFNAVNIQQQAVMFKSPPKSQGQPPSQLQYSPQQSYPGPMQYAMQPQLHNFQYHQMKNMMQPLPRSHSNQTPEPGKK